MLPPISCISSIEMIRDGGSLNASFVGANRSTYCLHFQLISESRLTGELVRLGYAKPTIYERIQFREDAKVEWQSFNEVEVSWEHAKAVLHQLRRHLRDDTDAKWLEAMEESANSEGGLPAGIARVLQPVHHNARDA